MSFHLPDKTVKKSVLSFCKGLTLAPSSNVHSEHLITLHEHTQPFYGHLRFCLGLPGWAGTRKVKTGR